MQTSSWRSLRRSGSGRKDLPVIPRQRMRICAHAGGTRQGVADTNDRPPLREACGRLPVSGTDLMSQPTLSRLENAPCWRQLARMGLELIDLFCARFDRRHCDAADRRHFPLFGKSVPPLIARRCCRHLVPVRNGARPFAISRSHSVLPRLAPAASGRWNPHGGRGVPRRRYVAEAVLAGNYRVENWPPTQLLPTQYACGVVKGSVDIGIADCHFPAARAVHFERFLPCSLEALRVRLDICGRSPICFWTVKKK